MEINISSILIGIGLFVLIVAIVASYGNLIQIKLLQDEVKRQQNIINMILNNLQQFSDDDNSNE